MITKMERLTYVSVLLFMYLKTCTCVNALFALHNAYTIDTAGYAFEGYVDSKTKAGDKVPVIQAKGKWFIEHSKEVSYLQVVIRKKVTPKQGAKFVIVDTDAFLVDDYGYLRVNNTKSFEHAVTIEVYVVMLADGEVVSNPVPFIIIAGNLPTAKSSTNSLPPAVFAVGLICLIVIFAFLIPFLVRRFRSGKPVFKLGSRTESTLNLNKTIDNEKGSQPQLTTNEVADFTQYFYPHQHLFAPTLTEGDFYENRGYRPEGTCQEQQNGMSKYPLQFARHIQEHDNGIVIHLEKKQRSDSDYGISSDTVSCR